MFEYLAGRILNAIAFFEESSGKLEKFEITELTLQRIMALHKAAKKLQKTIDRLLLAIEKNAEERLLEKEKKSA